MSNCVVRFGGSSLSKFPVLEAFASLLSESENDETVVVSAVPEILEILEQGIESLIINSVTSDFIIDQIQNQVNERLNVFHPSRSDENLINELKNLQNLLKGIEFTGDFSLSLKDQVISYSERISACILHLFLSESQVSSNLLFPENIGLIVTKEYGNATILYEESAKLLSLLPKGINLIPGSYGITSGGKVARLGKRSADYSAAGITRLIGADSLQLWELDAEFRTSDAAFVPDSQLISRLTYAEASELSYFSEQSIHPRIVEPLISNHIPVHVYRLKNKGKELTTIINSESFVTPNVVKSVVHTEEIAVLKLNGPGVGFKPGILAKVTTAFHQSAINIRSVITSQVSINIILNKNEIEKARQICSQLPLTSVSEIVIEDQVSLIAVVGHGMQQHHGVSAKLFTAVAQHKINVLLSGSGASDLVSYLIVDQKDTQKAITEIHNIFFKSIF
ncbi:aspartokinase [Aquipluma nitroreducens]|uniref:Aspartokinase n=1 Tax=Aquipluma nitroreducens TaxID=2010828 RepID=A0A5K7SGZ8_9BACT|nr:aspartate kinase [Aquipluma nitroreducens]BBE20755.1 aspartokinase [Aquipluma nitroreducens]